MGISCENVEIDGKEFKKYYSDENYKIKCIDDGNVYQVAYVTKNSTMTISNFEQTDIPLNQIIPGIALSAEDIAGLSDYIGSYVDGLDGLQDDRYTIDLGGAKQ